MTDIVMGNVAELRAEIGRLAQLLDLATAELADANERLLKQRDDATMIERLRAELAEAYERIAWFEYHDEGCGTARNDALEEAAKVAEHFHHGLACAAAIRALKEKVDA